MRTSANQIVHAGCYVRVSTENQIENYSTEEQIERLKAYCKAKGWEVYQFYTDAGYSGGNTHRPALEQMIKAVQAHKIDIVVVYKLDRLSRSQKDTLTLIEDCFLASQVDFVSINENFDTSTPFGRAMIGILSVFAQLEKDQITERFTMGRIGRGKAGYYHGGGVSPLGYNYTNGELMVNDYEALQVRSIFDLFLSGKSIHAVWHEMQKTYAGKWSAQKIRMILLNSLYIGKVKFAGVEYDGKHTPIVSEKLFEYAGILLASKEREDRKTAAQKTPFRAENLLSSLVVCARCGARYSGNHGYYRCYSRSKSSKQFIADPNCKNDNWEIDDLNSKVVKSICKVLHGKKLFDTVLNSEAQRQPIDDIPAIKFRLKEVQVQIEKLLDLYQISAIPIEILTKRIGALSSEKVSVEKILAAQSGSPQKTKTQFVKSARLFETQFETAPLETRRLLVSSVVCSVVVDGADISIKWRV